MRESTALHRYSTVTAVTVVSRATSAKTAAGAGTAFRGIRSTRRPASAGRTASGGSAPRPKRGRRNWSSPLPPTNHRIPLKVPRAATHQPNQSSCSHSLTQAPSIAQIRVMPLCRHPVLSGRPLHRFLRKHPRLQAKDATNGHQESSRGAFSGSRP